MEYRSEKRGPSQGYSSKQAYSGGRMDFTGCEVASSSVNDGYGTSVLPSLLPGPLATIFTIFLAFSMGSLT